MPLVPEYSDHTSEILQRVFVSSVYIYIYIYIRSNNSLYELLHGFRKKSGFTGLHEYV